MKLSPIIWLAIGFGIMALEVIIPGFTLFWFGVGAILTALFVWINVLTHAHFQWLFFFLSSLGFVTLWHFYLKKLEFFRKEVEDEYRDSTLVHLRGKVTEKIEPGKPGKVELYEPFHSIKVWKAEADKILEVDTEISVLESTGIKLIVEEVK